MGSEKKRARESEDALPEKKKAKASALTITVTVGGELRDVAKAESFEAANLGSKLTEVLQGQFAAPTPIQAVAWPLLMERLDLIGIAKTGSGKTLGFAVPFFALTLSKALDHYEPCNAPRMVTLAPTRELTQQIAEVVEDLAQNLSKKKVKFPVVTIVGGMPKREQRDKLAAGVTVACCTPGRLQDLSEEGCIELGYTQFLVLDEADRMLDMGFIDVIRKIIGQMPESRQTALFSATWPENVEAFARGLVKKGPKLAKVTVGQGDGDGTVLRANMAITQIVEIVQKKDEKLKKLWPLLKQSKAKKTIIFALYKKECSWLHMMLKKDGYDIGCLHGDMTQDARNRSIDDFKKDKIPMLVATDVAGRGLDVQDVELVVNYTFPLTIEDYIHRIGRTGRAGKTGRSVTYFCPNDSTPGVDEKALAHDLVKVLSDAKQDVPSDLQKVADGAGGSKATKKKAHSLYGSHFKDEAEMAKLEAQKTHVTFDDSDDD
jgi:ATP-dependent RNA helicase DBP3